MTKSDRLRAWYSEIREQGNTEAIDQFFAPGILAERLFPELLVGADDFSDLVMALRHALGDISVKLPKIIEIGDWLSGILHVRKCRTDNGAPFEATGQVMTRSKGDRMVEACNQLISFLF